MCAKITRFRQARLARNIKAVDVAAQLGVSLNTLYAYERGTTKPDSIIVKRMAMLYETSADKLIGTDNDY